MPAPGAGAPDPRTRFAERILPVMTAGIHEEYANEVGDRADAVKFRSGTAENAAWHMGYVAAMGDTLSMIKRREGDYPISRPVSDASEGKLKSGREVPSRH